MQAKLFNIETEAAMLQLGSALAKASEKPAVIFLQGSLGAGKTTFSRGFLQGLGYKGHVKSPTYTLVEPYDLEAASVYHFDLYRLNDPEELAYIGIEEYFTEDAICLVEWPELGEGKLPSADLSCKIEFEASGRSVQFIPLSLKGTTILRRLNYGE